MVKIRLARIGRKDLPTYRVVVSDSRKTPTSACIADLGYFDPVTEKSNINVEEAVNWLNKGAIASDSVKTIFKKFGINKQFADAKNAARKALDDKKTTKKKHSAPKKRVRAKKVVVAPAAKTEEAPKAAEVKADDKAVEAK
jgi:small subunit ribosomal protein S16